MRVERKDVDFNIPPTYLSEVRSLITWDYFCYRNYKDERAFDSIIDVGCNTGTLSVFARVLFPFSRIYSFDASPAAISCTYKYTQFFNRMEACGASWDVYNYGL